MPEHAGGGGEVDDATLVLLLHVGEGGLRHAEEPIAPDSPGFEHVVVFGVLDGLGGDDGLAVVDNHVDGAVVSTAFATTSKTRSRSAESQVMAKPSPPSSRISAMVASMGSATAVAMT